MAYPLYMYPFPLLYSGLLIVGVSKSTLTTDLDGEIVSVDRLAQALRPIFFILLLSFAPKHHGPYRALCRPHHNNVGIGSPYSFYGTFNV